MTRLLRITGLMIGLLLTAQTLAAELLTMGETTTLRSEVLGEERTLMVYLPRGYEQQTDRYPVIYLLDARTRFHHTSGTVEALARIGQIPEMIVVGVTNTDRTRDLVPPWTRPADDAPEWARNAIPQAGGADEFLRFLRDELIPHVDATYRTAPFRILVGHSFGGLFAVHALVNFPGLFDATLAISPSLQWDAGLVVDQAAELFERQPDLEGHLYLTLGDEGGDMLANVRRLETLLRYRAPSRLHWQAVYFDAENHGSVPIPSVHGGLKAFFPRWQAPPFDLDDGLEGVDRHYARLSAEYGFAIPTPENVVNNLGYRALGQGELKEAIAIFEANVERYPGSANVYDSLGEAMEAAGKLQEARDLYQRAAEMGEHSGDPNLDAYRGHLEAVAAKLREAS